MAAKVVTLQKADGYWPASLLDNDPGTPPESSGTAFFTYAFAWGVDNGLLDRTTYEPAAVRGWGALGRAVQPAGMLGWVQQIGREPVCTTVSNSHHVCPLLLVKKKKQT